MQKFLQKFKRVTYSTSYLPEIDGLRFLAIFSVVVILHITNYLDEKFYNYQFLPQGYWKSFAAGGGHGVDLFFVISGFILSLPFAKWRLNGGKNVSLKNYYLRRLTRLEPPYIIALIILFIASVWLLHKYSFEDLLPHFLASVVYVHTIIYQTFSLVLPVAWSLEVEVQFYVLAPLFFLIFLIRPRVIRRSILLLIIVLSSYYWFDYWHVGNVFTFLHLFFIGILLADLHCSGVVLIKNESAGLLIGLLSLAGFLFIQSIYWEDDAIHTSNGYFLKLLCIFTLFQCVMNNKHMKRLFSLPVLTIIGGMCYSIYLLHFAVISAAGSLLMKLNFDFSNKLYFPLYVCLLSLVVLVISSLYFLFVEKPFMRPFQFLRKR